MSDWLVDYYALTTVVLVAAVVVIGRLRQPARRLTIARSAVVALAMLAVLAALPGWPRASWRSRPGQTPSDRPTVAEASGPDSRITTPAQLGARPGPPDATPTGPSLPAEREESIRAGGASAQPPVGPSVRIPAVEWTSDWPDLAGRAFVAGGALALAWLGIGLWQTTVLRRRSRPAPRWSRDVLASIVGDGRSAPDLLVSDRLAQPVAVGVLSPAIVVPERFVEDEPRCRLEAALAHEWVHLRNRDLWWIALSGLLMPVLFAHPVYWWLRRRTREDQELLADAAAAQGRVDYAEALLAWARRTPRPLPLAVAGSLALWERPSQLKRRIIMLLDRDFRVEPTCPRRWGLGVRAGTVLAVLALSFMTFRPSVVEADPAGPTAAPQSVESPGAKAGRDAEAGATRRVLDPDGKPVAGATVYRSHSESDPLDRDPKDAVPLTRTGPDGSFRLSPGDVKAAADRSVQIVAMAEGYGPAFLEPAGGDAAPVLRLARDDVAIRGRVIDIQGRPVAGTTIQVVGILRPNSGTLDEWLDALKRERVAYPAQSTMLRSWSGDDLPALFPAVVADREGRFMVKGVGRERIAALFVSGPGIETIFVYAATRDMPAVKVSRLGQALPSERDAVVYHGAAPDLAAGPGLEIVGTVRDKANGRPLAGITVQTTLPIGDPSRYFKTTTDARGDYRLSGLSPKNMFGEDQEILAGAKEGPPFVPALQHASETPGRAPVRRDFALRRGAWVRGRVIDRSTGKSVPAALNYFILEDNPHLDDYPGYGTLRFMRPYRTDENGEFRIAVLPGRGILGAWAAGPYRLAVGLEHIKGRDPRGLEVVNARPNEVIPANFNTLIEIDPRPGEESVTVDIGLDRGRTLKGKLVGPDGEPVVGALMVGAEDFYQRWSERPLPTAEFEVHALGTQRKRGLLFYHESKHLAGAYLIKPDEAGPLTVRLEPCGTLSGRVLDRGGLPLAGALLRCNRPILFGEDGAEFDNGALPSSIRTDKDGRFRTSGLVPGLKYTMTAWKDGRFAGRAAADVIIRAGEVKELGDVKAED
jgi:protocatechuate 3,4-dioxygenase beta subunit